MSARTCPLPCVGCSGVAFPTVSVLKGLGDGGSGRIQASLIIQVFGDRVKPPTPLDSSVVL